MLYYLVHETEIYGMEIVFFGDDLIKNIFDIVGILRMDFYKIFIHVYVKFFLHVIFTKLDYFSVKRSVMQIFHN